MSSVPADLLYSAEHEWVSGDVEPGSVVTVGITEHAAINDEPYEGGWIFKVEVSEDIELLDADAYADHIA